MANDLRVIFYCVLRYGGEYRAEHVFRLYRQIEKHAGGSFMFAVMTDAPHKVTENTPADLEGKILEIPLQDGWPGWWSKMEMFRTLPGLPLIYFDLDTSIVGDLSPIVDAAKKHRFIILEDFYRGAGTMQSSVLSWSNNEFAQRLYAAFQPRAGEYMARFKDGGDQAFIEAALASQCIPRWQELLPGAFVSYKANNIAEKGVPEGARVVIFHGEPRPWDPKVKNVD